jgi:hypothetical protein
VKVVVELTDDAGDLPRRLVPRDLGFHQDPDPVLALIHGGERTHLPLEHHQFTGGIALRPDRGFHPALADIAGEPLEILGQIGLGPHVRTDDQRAGVDQQVLAAVLEHDRDTGSVEPDPAARASEEDDAAS